LGGCDISGNKPTCIQDGTCPNSTSLRCLPYLSTLSGYSGKDGCSGYRHTSLPYAGGCTGAGGWRCINSMCVQSANATMPKETCLAVCGATMPVASTKGMAVKGTLSSGTVHIN
jgi:hypothetical protein